MEAVWLAIALIAGLVWAGMSIKQKRDGDLHHAAARRLAAAGDWEAAPGAYKQAILVRLDACEKLEELLADLQSLYLGQGLEVDLGQLRECPEVIRSLTAGSRDLKKKKQLLIKVYVGAQEFMDQLPGARIPDDGAAAA